MLSGPSGSAQRQVEADYDWGHVMHGFDPANVLPGDPGSNISRPAGVAHAIFSTCEFAIGKPTRLRPISPCR